MARRLAQTPNLLKTHGGIIADQEDRGFIERIQPQGNEREVHHIPHHPVIKESTTTPVRIVYDCRCRQSSPTGPKFERLPTNWTTSSDRHVFYHPTYTPLCFLH